MLKRLIGIYNADGGLLGEATYVVGHLLGLVECSLCDITHSPFRRKPQWDSFVATLPCEFSLLHRNEVTPELEQWMEGRSLPLVVGESLDNEFVLVLDHEGLSSCAGSLESFSLRLNSALENL
jgi:hypothetical protein